MYTDKHLIAPGREGWRLCMLTHAGFFTLFLLGGFAGGMPQRILCCEPAPANMKLLRRNVEMAGVAQKVQRAHCQLLFALLPK